MATLKPLLLAICLTLEFLSVGSQRSYLSLNCSSVANGCPYPSSRCNQSLRRCECVDEYPIPLFYANICVQYRSLGQECIVSHQCRVVDNSYCVSSKNIEVSEVKARKKPKAKGLCKCRPGYRQTANNRCDRISKPNHLCEASFECQKEDLNSHCDSSTNQCYCDPGFVFDYDRSGCVVHIHKHGTMCARNDQCTRWDTNMECRNGDCLCKFGHEFVDQRCKLLPSIKSLRHICEYGLRWDESANQCRPLPIYDLKVGDYRYFSVDKLLETIVIVIFCFVTIAFMRFWRYILPQNIIFESQTGMFSDFGHANRVQRRRSSRTNSLRSGRVVRLRVNLESPELTDSSLPEEAFVALPLTSSHSSLPPYESATNSAAVTTEQTPYDDQPPTYEEAMALSLNNKQ